MTPSLGSAVLIAALLLGSGCTAADEPGVAPSPEPTVLVDRTTPRPTPVVPGPAALAAKERLARLRVIARPGRPTDYSRDLFGPRWTDVDGNGCNQRDDVLVRDGRRGTVRGTTQGPCDHDVVAGTWDDPYTGAALTFTDLKDPRQAQAIQIDHVVPLAEAWVSGARAWSPGRRLAFANDLTVLLAVDGPMNASKGSSDPAAWRPRKGYQCAYAVRWITIKHDWRMVVDPSEVRALEDMLRFCR